MSQENRPTDLREHTKQLLAGSLKHVRAAGLAAALVPLAAVAASAQSALSCPSGGLCGFVWQDTNGNGIQDAGEPAISGAVVTLTSPSYPGGWTTGTDTSGMFNYDVPLGETYTISVQIPNGMTVSPTDVATTTDAFDSDGTNDNKGNSVTSVTHDGNFPNLAFGFVPAVVKSPGTGTPGYWKNHPEAWPVATITVGGYTYTRDQAIAWLDTVGKDKTTTMFSSLVSAKLNVMIGNDSSCVASTIAAADDWMKMYGPVGHGVAASSVAWKLGEPLHRLMDNYNNGMLCAPHRD